MDGRSDVFLGDQMGFFDRPKTNMMARPSDFYDGLE
jgi:hypothetical protein